MIAIYRAVLYRFDSHCSLKNSLRGRRRLLFLVGFYRAREAETRDSSKTGARFAGFKARMAGYRKQPRQNVSLGITELSKNLDRDDGIEKPYFACVSNHKLMIGTGRYDQSPHDKRL